MSLYSGTDHFNSISFGNKPSSTVKTKNFFTKRLCNMQYSPHYGVKCIKVICRDLNNREISCSCFLCMDGTMLLVKASPGTFWSLTLFLS